MMVRSSANFDRVRVSGIIAVLLAAACWASSGVFVKLILLAGPITSLLLAFWRDTVAFAVFLVLALCMNRRQMRIKKKDWPRLALMGISLGVFHVVLNLGYLLNGAAITTIQQAAMPAIVLVVARMIWKEPFTGMKIFSLILICIGTVLVSGLVQAHAPDVTAGSILVGFLIPILYASWSLFGKALRSEYSAVVTLTWAFGIASLILLPCQLFSGSILPPAVPIQFYLWFAGLIVIATAAGFILFTFALGRLPASVATILVMSEIAYGVTYAHFILGEILSVGDIAGAFLIVAGVTLTTLHRKSLSVSPVIQHASGGPHSKLFLRK
jgi:drug/metabolite transporter, DME family